ncbi:DUF4468 domain-containing protein [Paraflavitalea pollutisoli]|uniref:DUF4468 domain-containing protein n=1 Tax=Paraflavitalea pollutisoli TaxID=3034143 RepID=UPI0023EDBF7A|nr:DUF4468 domain-containing protein [Paraflavitalea sp. H1-2-19X]
MKGLLFFFLVAPFISFSQTAQDSVISFTEVVRCDSIKKEELFVKARQWFNASFKDARSVVRIADKETGEIVAKGIVISQHWYKALGKENKIPILYEADIAIYVKDGRYKYEFKNFIDIEESSIKYTGPLTTAKAYPAKGYRNKVIMDKIWNSQKEEIAITISELVVGLKSYMSKPADDF